jgi:hypothetical protein
LAEDEPLGVGHPTFESGIPSPAPEGEFLTSPEEAQAQAREAFDRMRAYRGLMRGLTESEWKSSGTRILILEHIARLEDELSELQKYRSQYHEKDKESAVLRQKLRQSTAVDMLFDLALAVGGILVGLGPSLYDKGFVIICLFLFLTGAILVACPVLLRLHQKSD